MGFDLGNGIPESPSPSSAAWGGWRRALRSRITQDLCPLAGDTTIYVRSGASGGDGTEGNPYSLPTPIAIGDLIDDEDPGSGQRLRVRLAQDSIFRINHAIADPTELKGIRILSGFAGSLTIDSYRRSTFNNSNWGGAFVRKPIITGCVLASVLRTGAGDPTRPDAANYPNVWKIPLPAGRTWGISQVFFPNFDWLDSPWTKVSPASLSGDDAARAAIIDAAGLFVPKWVTQTTSAFAPTRLLRCGGAGSNTEPDDVADVKTRMDRAFCYDAANDCLWVKLPKYMLPSPLNAAGMITRLGQMECVLEFPTTAAGQQNSGIWVNKTATRLHGLAVVGWGPGAIGATNTQTAPILFDQVAVGCGTMNSCFYSSSHTYHALVNSGSVVMLHGEVGLAERTDTGGDPTNINALSRHIDGASLVNSYCVAGNHHMIADFRCELGTLPYDGQFATRGKAFFSHTGGGASKGGLHIVTVRTEKGSIFGPRTHGNMGDIPAPTTRADHDEHAFIMEGCVHLPNGHLQKLPSMRAGTIIKDCFYDITTGASNADGVVSLDISIDNGAVLNNNKIRARVILNLDEGGSNEISFVRRGNPGTMDNLMDVINSDIVIDVPDTSNRSVVWDGRANAAGQDHCRFVRSVLGFPGANQLRAYRNGNCDDQTIGGTEPFVGGFRNVAFGSTTSALVPDSSASPVWLGSETPLYGPGLGPDKAENDALIADPAINNPPGTIFYNVYDRVRGDWITVDENFWKDRIGTVALSTANGGGGQEGLRNRNFR